MGNNVTVSDLFEFLREFKVKTQEAMEAISILENFQKFLTKSESFRDFSKKIPEGIKENLIEEIQIDFESDNCDNNNNEFDHCDHNHSLECQKRIKSS